MPLPSVSLAKINQCSAQAKSTKRRCLNPAAFGCRTCRMHGARKQSSIKRDQLHPNYRHGFETLSSKRDRSKKLAEMRALENDLIMRGLIDDKYTVGRKPKYKNK